MAINTLALFFLIAVVFVLAGLTMFVLVRLVSASRKLREAEENTASMFMTAALQDAVGRMRAHERELAARVEASERLSDQIVDSLPSGLLVTNANGEPQRLNPAGARMLGLQDVSPGPELWSRLGPSGASMRGLIDECLATGEGSSRRTIVIDEPGGGRRHLGAGVSPLRDGTGALTGAICLFTDLTAVVDLEEQLRLKDSLARLGELTAGLAHEFRNGLATIHGYARLMNPEKLPADHRGYVESLRAETDSLTEIVANFLAFAKPAAEAHLPTPLAPVIARAVDEAAADAARQGGTVDAAGEFGEIEGDDVLMRQAISNVLRNAIEACVDAGIAPRVRVRGSIDHASNLQRIVISDNGPGIPASAAGKVFRPFFTTRARGTGLGLSLVQKIIVWHNGRIAVSAAAGDGAEFTIVLPLLSRRN